MNDINSMASGSDARTVNNTMRHQYRVLNELEKAQMLRIKDLGQEFLAELYNLSGSLSAFNAGVRDVRLISRELSLAQTKIEEAVMWAVKHVTG